MGLSSGTDISQRKFEEWIQYWRDLRNLPNKIVAENINVLDVKFPKQPA